MRSLKATVLFCSVGLFAGVVGLEALGQTELPSAPSTAQPQGPFQKTPNPQVGSARQESTQPTPAKPDAAPSSGSTENQQTGTPQASESASDDQSVATIRHTVNEVNVVFTVTDKHGHYVKDLKKENF